VREGELLKAVLTAWNGIANSATLLPGGLHEFVAMDDNTPPSALKWGTMRAVEGSLPRQTNAGPIREHIITITVNDSSGEGLIANMPLMDKLGTIPSVVTKALDNGGTIIDMFSHNAPDGGQGNATRRTKNMIKQSVAWRVQSRWPY
jgi:hypothetical protein